MSNTAVIFGVAGQDGSYLSELLLGKNYRVIGVTRRSSVPRYDNLSSLLNNPNFTLVEGDITDPSSVNKIMIDYKPDECYNLAAQSHVASSFEQPTCTFNINAVGTLNILDGIKMHSPTTRMYQASTSELFGNNYHKEPSKYDERNEPYAYIKYQDETVPFSPRSPYGVSKLAAHELVRVYRQSYGLYACAGILFNHESERRGHNFLTRKVTKWLGQFYRDHGMKMAGGNIPVIPDRDKLRLGNLDAYRDWGHAEDYVRAMHMMLNQPTPKDYVVSTGESHTVREFVDKAFRVVNKSLDYNNYIIIDPKFYRPCEVDYLEGRSYRIQAELGWQPTINFNQLVTRMVEGDMYG